MGNFKANAHLFSSLTLRNLKLFLKDKMQVFFSILGPLIIVMLYVLFLGDTQVDTLRGMLPQSLVDDKLIEGVVNGWMLSGVLSVTCITVAVSVSGVAVNDRERGVNADFIASPANPYIVRLAYFASSYICTLIISAIIMAIGFIYLAVAGWYLSAIDVIAIIGNLALSVLSSTLFATIAISFIRTTNALGGFIGVLSAAIGFLMGAYMPLSLMGKGVEYFACLLPGTYSAGIFRYLFVNGVMGELAEILPQTAIDEISQAYAIKINFFGANIEPGVSAAILAVSVIVFAAVLAIISFVKAKDKGPGKIRKN